jgi:hypothetical protein
MIETKKKNLIICSNCESNGKKSILGELGTAGEFIVQRFHQGETIIKAPIMAIVCSYCHGTAYIKNESVINYQFTRLSFTGTI